MLKEYAVNPCIAEDLKTFLHTIDKFEFENPRRIGLIPKKWGKKVLQKLDENSLDPNYNIKRTMIVSFLADTLPYVTLKRKYITGESWEETVSLSNSQKPFHGVINAVDINDIDVISPEDVLNFNPAIKLNNFIKTTKTEAHFMGLFGDVLLQAKYIYFLDPYFDPYNLKCQNLFKAFCRKINSRPDATNVDLRICTSSDRRSGNNEGPYAAGDEPRFKSDVLGFFELDKIKDKLSVYLSPHDQGMHARYLITDIGAFSLDHSFSIDDVAEFTTTMQTKKIADDIIRRYFGG